MASNSVENLKRIAKYLKVTPGTFAINKEKVNKTFFFCPCFFFFCTFKHNLNQISRQNQ